jgi:O-antigen/teichoic acid export membrane protein
MLHSTKLLLNTIASYARIIVNTIITLFGTRIALKCLGADDFGLYNLIAGIVVLLSFINGSLMISSQRFFSFSIGEKDENKLGRYFNASLGIHIIIAFLIGLILWGITPLLFNGFLNIPQSRIVTAKIIYYIMIVSAMITVGTIPYSAIMNAREDLIILSTCDIISCIVKLGAALALLFINKYLLLTYTLLMLSSVLIKMALEIIWSKKMYNETRIYVTQLYDKNLYHEMLGFIGWNTLGSTAVLIRNQGVAVALNVFFGTAINAAYGIANQVNSLVLSFASTLTTVFAPTIIQAKGAKDEVRMLNTAIFSSKLSFYLSSAMALPILLFLKPILHIWLGEYPPSTIEFCQYIILSFLVLQLYPGINRAIYATGKIKGYQISISILLVAIIPIGCFLFKEGYPPYSIMLVMFVSQVMTLFATIHYGKKFCGLNSFDFLYHSIFIPVVIFTFFIYTAHYISTLWGTNHTITQILFVTITFEILYTALYYYTTFVSEEKKMLSSFLKKHIKTY